MAQAHMARAKALVMVRAKALVMARTKALVMARAKARDMARAKALVMARAKALVMARAKARVMARAKALVMARVMARSSVTDLQLLAANPGRLAKRISPSSRRVLAMVWPIPRRAVSSTSVWRRKARMMPRFTARTRARWAEVFA